FPPPRRSFPSTTLFRSTSGVICLPVVGARLDELRIPLMVADNTESQRTAFTVSVDAKTGTTTGISAADRAATIRALIDRNTGPEDRKSTRLNSSHGSIS